jgi:small-conductance mechanosensitive channel
MGERRYIKYAGDWPYAYEVYRRKALYVWYLQETGLMHVMFSGEKSYICEVLQEISFFLSLFFAYDFAKHIVYIVEINLSHVSFTVSFWSHPVHQRLICMKSARKYLWKQTWKVTFLHIKDKSHPYASCKKTFGDIHRHMQCCYCTHL